MNIPAENTAGSDKQYIVSVGTIKGGFKLIGPFDSAKDAMDFGYAEVPDHFSEEWDHASLTNPKDAPALFERMIQAPIREDA